MATTTLDFKRAFALSKNKAPVNTYLGRQVFAVVLALLIFGTIEIFSASRYMAVELKGNPYYFGGLHLFFVLATLGAIAAFQVIPQKAWKPFTRIGFLGLIATLAAVYFFSAENGAHRWIPLGSFTFQPSEFAKLGVIMLGALLLYKVDWDQDKTVWDHIIRFVMISIPILIIAGLVVFQPDYGNTAIMGLSYIAMYLVVSKKWKYKALMVIVPVVSLIGAALILLTPYRLQRFETYFELMKTGIVQDEFGKGLQTRNILIGVGSGGLWGKGIGGSQLKHGYFVEVTAFTDSIAAVIFEELGFFLGSVFVCLYLYLFYLFIKIAEAQHSQYQRLIMWGIATWFITQTFIHFGANVALIPVKGTTLPFVSYGGTSLVAFGVAAGMAIRLAREPSGTA